VVVPETAPVDAFKANPVGKAPVFSVQVSAPMPPLAAALPA